MKRFCIVLAALGWAAISTAAAQQGKAPWEEFENRLKDSQSVSALGPDLFGDNVGLSDGALSFAATDIDLAGNDKLHVALSRKYVVSNRWEYISDSPLADWELDVPRITGIFAPNWTVSNPTPSVARCSNVALPTQPLRDYHARDFWHGNVLALPGGGGGGGELLLASGQLPAPATGENYIWTTSDHVRIACLPQTKNATGEGYLAITPDGTRYWFDWMAQYQEPLLVMPGRRGLTGVIDDNPVQRRKNVLYATKVQDRFGNTVNYTYTNAWNAPAVLTTIAASDGRRIDLTYASGNISTVRAGTQTWTYVYGNTPKGKRTLTEVRQPDLSKWTVGFAQFTDAYIEYRVGSQLEPARSCLWSDPPINSGDQPLGTIKHPSGAVGTFRVGILTHGRSGVPINCANVVLVPGELGLRNDTNDDMNLHGISYDSFTLLDKEISGPALSTQQWSYSYSPNFSYFLTEGATVKYPVCSLYNDPVRWKECHEPRCVSDDCASASETTIVGSDGTWTKYYYGNSYLYNEGKLLKVEQGSDEAHVLRSVVNAYDLSRTDRVYPASIGHAPFRQIDESFGAQYTRPLTSEVTTQDGATFAASNDVFDVFARPLTVTKSSSTGGYKVDGVVYSDNLAKWVLGQAARTTTNGIEVSKTDYDPATALPVQSYAFGKPQQSFTWDTAPGTQAGTLKALRDGNSNTTTLGNWKRGLPQLIKFPATVDQPTAVSRTAVVNDDGRVLSVTDENAFSTAYSYDAMGRLAMINYPTGDSVAWTSTFASFVSSTTALYGLPIGHWQQTVRTGNGYKVVHYDAMWRPVVEETYDSGNLAGTRSIVVHRYDAKGRLAFRSYPRPNLGSFTDATLKGVHTEYDALDRVTAVKQDSELGLLTTTTEYLTGFRTRVTSPKHQGTSIATVTSYRAWDQPTTAYPVGIAAPEGAYTDIVRDVFGKPTSIKRRDLTGGVAVTRSYAYDARQQLCKSVEPETGATLMGYDAANNLSWSAAGLPASTACDPEGDTAAILARRTLRSYDARNRLRALTFPDGLADTTYGYTHDGLLARVTALNGGTNQVTTQYTYNKRRLPTSERLLWGAAGIDWPINYGYDSNGSLAVQNWHGLNVSFAPNALGQPTQAGTYASGVSYFPNGAIKQFTYGNGIIHTLAQNVRQLPDTSRDAYGAAEVLDDGYDYDKNGNVAAISDGLIGARGNRTMSYDGLDRLKTTVSPMYGAIGATYTYDVLDNLKTLRAPDRNHLYFYDASQRLTNVANAVGGASVVGLGYDVQGNLANKNGQIFSFDQGNRLRGVSGGAGSYVYDGHGRRVRDVTTASKYSQYSMTGQLAITSDGRAGTVNEYVYLGGSLVAIRERNVATNVYTDKYQHTDALGTPVAVTNSARTVLERSEYEPYGKMLNRAVKDGPGYTGHVEDAATGLTYMQQRYYDPTLGRFLSVDPVTAYDNGDLRFFNRYSYAANAPYTFTDPDGREIKPTGTRAEIRAINRAVKKIERSNPASKARMQSMRNSAHVHTIRFPQPGESPENKTTGAKANESDAGVGTGSETIVDLRAQITTVNTDGTPITSSGETVLTHELLGHGGDKDKGVMDRSINPATGERRSEERAMDAENEYKDAVGEPRRDCHSRC